MIERPGALHFYDGHRVVSLGGDDAVVAALAAIASSQRPAHVDELAARIGFDAETTRQLLQLLSSNSVVDAGQGDARATTPVTAAAADAADFSRATVGGIITLTQARERLATTTVHVVGTRAADTADRLGLSGLRALPVDLAVLQNGPGLDREDVVVADADCSLQVNELSLRHGFAWLPIGDYDGAVIRVGPLVLPGQTACFHCVLTRLSANVEYPSIYHDVVASAPRAPAPEALSSWAMSVAAICLVRWIGSADPTLPGTLHTLVGADLSVRAGTVYRVPRCSSCAAQDYLPAAAPWEYVDVE
jgi:bacteriocin biosynthesis cyclodehydratase domain-containing protein